MAVMAYYLFVVADNYLSADYSFAVGMVPAMDVHYLNAAPLRGSLLRSIRKFRRVSDLVAVAVVAAATVLGQVAHFYALLTLSLLGEGCILVFLAQPLYELLWVVVSLCSSWLSLLMSLCSSLLEHLLNLAENQDDPTIIQRRNTYHLTRKSWSYHTVPN